jgi:hypothetical protein
MDTDTTLEQGASEAESEVRLSRDDVMASIASRRSEEFNSETEETETEAKEVEETETAEVEESEEELDTEEIAEDVDEQEESIDDTEAFKEEETAEIIINGEKKEVPISELIEAGKVASQKEQAAQAKFQKASEAFNALEQRAAELDAREKQLMQSTRQPLDKDAIATEFADAILEDESKAGQIVADTLARQAELEQRIEQMSGQLSFTESVAQKTLRDEAAANTKLYHEQYSDIANNDVLHNLAMTRAQEIRGLNPNLPEQEVIIQTGNEIRSWIKTLPGVTETEDKKTQQVKRQLPKQPKKTGARQPSKPVKKRKTASQLIQELRASRGFS